jgi:hypothetical protein
MKDKEVQNSSVFIMNNRLNRYLKGIHICGCRWNERLKVKTEGSTSLTYTGFHGELEHLKIETRLICESFECVMGPRVTV